MIHRLDFKSVGGSPKFRFPRKPWWKVTAEWCVSLFALRDTFEQEMAAMEKPPSPYKFKRGDRVRKSKGSSWQGYVVGDYSTRLTPFGVAVESEREPGSVQIYPQAALELVPDEWSEKDIP